MTATPLTAADLPKGTRVANTEGRLGTVNGVDVGRVEDTNHPNYGREYVGVNWDAIDGDMGLNRRSRPFVDELRIDLVQPAGDAGKPSLVAMMNRQLAPNRCIHNHYAAADVEGDPLAACATKRGETFGAFNAEGAFYAGDCAVDVANETAKEKLEDEDVYWRAMCREHEGEPADTCQECNAELDDES